MFDSALKFSKQINHVVKSRFSANSDQFSDLEKHLHINSLYFGITHLISCCSEVFTLMLCLGSWRPWTLFNSSKNILNIVLSAWLFTTFPNFIRNAHKRDFTLMTCFSLLQKMKHYFIYSWLNTIFICSLSVICLTALFMKHYLKPKSQINVFGDLTRR